ncbi:hypothetical protein BDB00DRAFT_789624 [Zychaea mexicana]|uniref:uncharacterized protein n=1 Tax=Zychaea mexicana TaxID=64656 RepID=UPI0022FE76A1|nr:uncharacterized protein BDB00DRAFT_789624 [Zychaea mexicana]KAI9491367.1 hypothetical protein BDB00DRAFT_789624 [Zychaea mexicana]
MAYFFPLVLPHSLFLSLFLFLLDIGPVFALSFFFSLLPSHLFLLTDTQTLHLINCMCVNAAVADDAVETTPSPVVIIYSNHTGGYHRYNDSHTTTIAAVT